MSVEGKAETMITNQGEYAKFESGLIKGHAADVEQNFRIVDALYYEAVELGIYPLKNPLEGLNAALTIAKVVNSVPGTPRQNRP